MRVFVFEFVSGGGLAGEPLPAAVAHEGALMLRALLDDLAEVPGIAVVAARDPRLPPLAGVETLTPLPGEDAVTLYRRGLAGADAAWPTAPETGGMLERLGRATLAAGVGLLGCHPDAVRVAASKRATAHALREAGVPVVPTLGPAHQPAGVAGAWVTKPDDGAGSEDTELHADWPAARARVLADPARLVAQPWIQGVPLSLSLVCGRGAARLLCCNRQEIGVREGRISLDGLVVNAVPDIGGRFEALARRVAGALPGLWGYVGVDLIEASDGPMVLEVNPRLTTSYCGLRSALGVNVGALVAGMRARPEREPAWNADRDTPVRLSLAPAHAR